MTIEITNGKKVRTVKVLREGDDFYVVRWVRPNGFADELTFSKSTGKAFRGGWKIA